MAVGLSESPSYPRHSHHTNYFFCHAAPWKTTEEQHTTSLKLVVLFLSSASLFPAFTFFSPSWWAPTFILTLVPFLSVQCALEMWPGGVGQCNAAPAPNRFIYGTHFSPFLDSKLLAALTPGAVLPAAPLFLLEMLHLPTLWLPPRTPPACIPSLWYLVHLASPVLMQLFRPTLVFKSLIPFCPLCIFSFCTFTTASCSWLFFVPPAFSSPFVSYRAL